MSIRDVLEGKEDAILGNGVSLDLIIAAEEQLALTFADDYKEYLSTVGLAMVNGHEFTGIGKTERTNVVSVTQQFKSLKQGIPADWYVIENENMDGAAIWQDSIGCVYFNKKLEYSSLREFINNI